MDEARKKKPTPPKFEDIKWTNRCYGYIRVSTKKQKDEGLSLEIQRKKINAYATMKDLDVIEIFSDEGISGKSIEGRKNLMKLLSIIQQGETFVTLTFSRLSRNVRDFLNIQFNLELKGCCLAIINEGLDTRTPYGRFTATMFSAVAQLEGDIISSRVQDAMNLKREKGEFMGRVPYGWKLSAGPGSDLIEIPYEQNVIKTIRTLRESITLQGRQWSYAKIAEKLNEDKIDPPGKSTRWGEKQVLRIYQRGPIRTKGRSPERQRKRSELDNIINQTGK